MIKKMKRKTKKEIRQRIKEAQANGQTNKEIYDKLSEEYYDEYDEAIARLILTTVKQKDKKKHRLYIGILLGLTAIVVLFNIWIVKESLLSPHPYFSFRSLSSQVGILTLLYLSSLFSVFQKPITSYIFWMCTCSYLIFCFLYLDVLEIQNTYWLYIAINLISIPSIIFLSRFFQRKIFPDYRYRRLKEDENGEYVFS